MRAAISGFIVTAFLVGGCSSDMDHSGMGPEGTSPDGTNNRPNMSDATNGRMNQGGLQNSTATGTGTMSGGQGRN